MNRLLFLLGTLLCLALPSCEKFDVPTLTPPEPSSSFDLQISPCDDGESIDISQIPQAIIDFLDENYPNSNISDADIHQFVNNVLAYAIELDDDLEILFDQNGLVISASNSDWDDDDDDIAIADLPASIIEYISTNYPNATIDEAEFDDFYGTTYIEVELDQFDDLELYFTIDGQFLCLDDSDDDDDDNGNDDDDDDGNDDDDDDGNDDDDDDGNDDDDDDGNDDDDDDGNDDDDDDGNDDDDDDGNDDDDDGNGNNGVPGLIVAYVSVNYQDYKIEEIELEDICGGVTVYEVELEGPDPDLELYFDLNYNFLFEAYDVTVADLPAAVVSTLDTDFAGYEIDTDELEQHVYPDGSIQYRVELTLADDDVELILDADGNVLCSDN